MSDIQTKLINEYANFKSVEDSTKTIQELVIPHFDEIACDLDEIIDGINQKYNIENESLDYIESLFNPNLYQVILSTLKTENSQDNMKHYLIVLIELTKYSRYLRIKNKLTNIGTTSEISNTMIYDGLIKASEQRLEDCVLRIKNVCEDLNSNFESFSLSRTTIDILLSSNNINLN